MNKKTVVIGVSAKQDRYSNKAVHLLRKNGFEVIALGFETSKVADVFIETDWGKYEDIDTVSLYFNPERQKAYYEYILNLKPRRIIFNPGTENKELEHSAQAQGIQTLEACTLVMLNTGQY